MKSYYQSNKEHLNSYKRNHLQQNIVDKKYHCESCQKSYRDKTQLNRHLRSKSHNNTYIRYKCPHLGCAYENNAQYHLNIHLSSRKHLNN